MLLFFGILISYLAIVLFFGIRFVLFWGAIQVRFFGGIWGKVPTHILDESGKPKKRARKFQFHIKYFMRVHLDCTNHEENDKVIESKPICTALSNLLNQGDQYGAV